MRTTFRARPGSALASAKGSRCASTRGGEGGAVADAATSKDSLPPLLRPTYQKKYHLKEEDLVEMRKLRDSDPRKWSRLRLAEKFQCSQFFVGLACQSHGTGPQDDWARKMEQVKRRWGRKKREAVEDRQRRKDLWGKDL